MARGTFQEPTNPYHYALHCIGGKWKMTILHEMYTFGKIHFNQTLKVLPISEKVLSQQLKELIEDGLVQRIVNGDTFPPTISYVLTMEGARLMPALDLLYIWSIRQMDAKGIPIDADAFVVHKAEKYVESIIADSAYKTPHICKKVFEDGRVLSTAYKRPQTRKGGTSGGSTYMMSITTV